VNYDWLTKRSDTAQHCWDSYCYLCTGLILGDAAATVSPVILKPAIKVSLILTVTAAWLFGSGLAGLIGRTRRRKAAKNYSMNHGSFRGRFYVWAMSVYAASKNFPEMLGMSHSGRPVFILHGDSQQEKYQERQVFDRYCWKTRTSEKAKFQTSPALLKRSV
jgi:hypothetical protein